MTIKHRGVKIVPVRTTRYEVRTIDGRKLKAFGSTTSARAWIDGYMKAFNDLTPKQAPRPVEAPVEKPKRRRRTVEAAAQASQ